MSDMNIRVIDKREGRYIHLGDTLGVLKAATKAAYDGPNAALYGPLMDEITALFKQARTLRAS